MKGKILNNRYDYIKRFIKNKDVLDLGCVDHKAETETTKRFWLHKFIKSHAKSVLGVDNEKEEVKKLVKKGYNIIIDDVETFDLKKKYERIVAGELIEHLSNVGLFLHSVKKHMNKDSLFLITTPNTFAMRRMIRNIFFGTNPNNVHHTYYFDYRTLKENFDRADFEIVEWYYFYDSTKPLIKHLIERFFVCIRSVFAPNVLFVLKKKK